MESFSVGESQPEMIGLQVCWVCVFLGSCKIVVFLGVDVGRGMCAFACRSFVVV